MPNIRVSRQRTKSVISEINFKGLVSSSIIGLNKMDGAHRLHINTTIEGIAPFYSELAHLSVVFNNIISNAIRFRHLYEVRPTLDITIEVDFDKAVIQMKDNGIGIAPEYHEKVFKMFFCVPDVKNEGSGIGLFAVRESVQKLKGNIRVVSAKGSGSNFIIEIPNKIDADLKRKLTKLLNQ